MMLEHNTRIIWNHHNVLHHPCPDTSLPPRPQITFTCMVSPYISILVWISVDDWWSYWILLDLLAVLWCHLLFRWSCRHQTTEPFTSGKDRGPGWAFDQSRTSQLSDLVDDRHRWRNSHGFRWNSETRINKNTWGWKLHNMIQDHTR